jgi:RNA polymerase sigma-70 factor (ECF subfamily)
MYNTSYRIVRSREDAEDIMQECFIKGFQKMHQIKEEVTLGAWLKRIVVNRSLDHVRKKKQETWIEETRILDTEAKEPELESYSEVSVDHIKKCMDQLKEKYRIILVLYMIEDYNHREISKLLNIKESTVRNQYTRGKSQLIDLLKKTKGNGFKTAHTGS